MKLSSLYTITIFWSRLIRTIPFTVSWSLWHSLLFYSKDTIFTIKGSEYDSIDESVFKWLAHLKNVEIIETSITTLPDSLFELENLNSLVLNGNKQIKDYVQLEKFKSLTIMNAEISKIPETIYNLINLNRINFSENQIDGIADKINNLINLTEVNLEHNKLEKIPETFCNLTNLEKIYFSYNKIKEIPDKIDNLNNLKEIKFEFNQIEKIPEALFKLKSLKELNLICNKIEFIPDSIGDLKIFFILDLSHNQIFKIPSNIQNAGLRELNLSYNFIFKKYLATTSDRKQCLKTMPPYKVVVGIQGRKSGFEHIIQSLKKEKCY